MRARLARGLRRLGLPGAVVFLAVAVVGVYVIARAFEAGPPPARSDVVRIGVADGDSVPAYAAASAARLRALPAGVPVYALVALSSYQSPAGVATIVGGVTGLDTVMAVARVPLPGRQSELVRLAADRIPADLTASMGSLADRKVADAAEYTRRALAAEPALKAQLDLGAQVATAEAEAYRRGCACVFALVVRASGATLVALAAVAGVRIVDPATGVERFDDAVFVPPLPEQVDEVAPLGDDGVTAGVQTPLS